MATNKCIRNSEEQDLEEWTGCEYEKSEERTFISFRKNKEGKS